MSVKDLYWQEMDMVRGRYHYNRNWLYVWLFLSVVLPISILVVSHDDALDYVMAAFALVVLLSGVVLSWWMMKFYRRRIKTLEEHPYGD